MESLPGKSLKTSYGGTTRVRSQVNKVQSSYQQATTNGHRIPKPKPGAYTPGNASSFQQGSQKKSSPYSQGAHLKNLNQGFGQAAAKANEKMR